jgi:hypothetical protein
LPLRGNRRKAKQVVFSAQVMSQSGDYVSAKHKAAKVIFRQKLPPLNTWKYLGKNAGATFFLAGRGRKVVVKPDVNALTFTPGKTTPRGEMFSVLTKVAKRGVQFENPLGRIRTTDGKWFFVTTMLEGETLEKKIKTMSLDEAEKTAKLMGQYLADMHKRGVNHLEPSLHNWVVGANTVMMVDGKYIVFKENFKTPTANVPSWETLTQESAKRTVLWLPKPVQQAFWEEYLRRIRK